VELKRMETMELVLDELKSRHVYKAETYAPFYVCSAMCHAFNLMNQKHKIYWEAKRLPNMRLHILFVAPAGYMKTFYLSSLGGDDYGIFRNCGLHVGREQSLTEAGFVGTIQNMNGVGITTEGAAQTFSDGLMLIDEFSAITNALKVQYNSQMDTQLLAALDHGHVNKRLGGGKIEYDTNLTLWAGVQPARYDLSAGLGRRMIFLLFLPNRNDNDKLLETVHHTRNIRPSISDMNKTWSSIERVIHSMDKIESIDFGDDVYKLYKDIKLFSYESSYFDRLLLGSHLATYGVEKNITVNISDQKILDLIKMEKSWRDSIVKGIDFVQMMKLIKTAGVETEESIEITRNLLIEEGIMVGWNAHQIGEKLLDMSKLGMLTLKGSRVIIDK
jgi:hypothetical protein